MRFVAVTLIVLNTIYAVAASNKVKFTEATTGGVLYKKLFLKILQYSQEKNCAGVSFLIKLQALSPVTLLKRLQHRCFPVNIVKFLRTPILKNICERLLLNSVWPLQFQMNQGYVFPKTKQILSHGSKHELSLLYREKNRETDLIFLSRWKFKLKRNCDDHPKKVKTIVFKSNQILIFTHIWYNLNTLR